MNTTEAASVDELCDVCKDIPFSEIKEFWFPSGPPEKRDKVRREIEKDGWRINEDFLSPLSTCSLCRLAASCCSEVGTNLEPSVWPFLRATLWKVSNTPQPPGLEVFYRCKSEPPRTPSPSYFHDTQNDPRYRLSTDCSFIIPLSRRLAGPGNWMTETFKVDPKIAAFDRLSRWLRTCGSKHRCVQALGSMRCIRGTRFIDCVTRKLVRIDDTAGSLAFDYIALSYVWGPSSGKDTARSFSRRKLKKRATSFGASTNTATSSASGTLPDRLPKTIEDAITAVSKLGLRYLWVDKYCIDQTDHDGKREQISAMDRIYANAWATIVACAGSNCEYGLPGVGSVLRTQQLSVRTPKMTLVLGFPPLRNVLEKTVWAKRGWTYQEAVLSRRLIFFTEYQVYAVCAGSANRFWCESLETVEASKTPNGFTTSIDPCIMFPDSYGNSGPGQIDAHLTEYTGRHLSFESDILDAFRGVLTRSPCYSYYGIPLFLETSGHWALGTSKFARALFWEQDFGQKGLTRRQGFPSWSWARWKGTVLPNYGGYHHYRDDDGRLKSAMVWIETTKATLVAFSDYLQKWPTPSVMLPLSPYIHLESVVIKLAFQKWTDSTAKFCHDHPVEGHPPALTTVRCQWSSVDFHEFQSLDLDVAGRQWDCVLVREYQSAQIRGSCCLVLEDNRDNSMVRVGTLNMWRCDEKWLDELCAKHGERKRIRLS